MSHVLQITSSQFSSEVLQSQVPVLVDFYATWCPPCRALAPHLDRLATDFADCAKVLKVNVDEEPRLAAQYRIQGVPTLILFSGGQPVRQMTGADPHTLRQMLSQACAA
jgi:thioredoxin 1